MKARVVTNKIRRRMSHYTDVALVALERKTHKSNFNDKMSAFPPNISIIAVNFNTLHLAKLMLLSLSETLGTSVSKIVLVDNGSKDNSCQFFEKLEAQSKKVLFVQNRTHRHHAGGLRAGIKALRVLESKLPLIEQTDIYLIADIDIIFLRRDLFDNTLPLFAEANVALLGEEQYDVGEPYIHPSCCLVNRLAYQDARIWPFVNSGAPALKMQQSMRKSGMSMIDFPIRTDEYIVHRGRGSIEGIKKYARHHAYSDVSNSPHFHGNPRGEELWTGLQRRYGDLLTPLREASLIAYIATNLNGRAS